MSERTVETTATQALRGLPLAAGGKTHCTDCHRTIREGDAVGVIATRTPDAAAFDTPRVHCRDCRPETVPDETSDACQLVVYGTLAVTSDAASREARVTLRAPELVADDAS